MKLSELIAVVPFIHAAGVEADIEITAIETDSRLVQPGSLFVCIRGINTDGHMYAEEAAAKGAAAIVAEEEVTSEIPVYIVSDTVHVLARLVHKFYDYPTSSLPLIGITGTNGKTTVSYLLEAIFKNHSKKTGVIGSIQNKIGDETFPATHTTPDILELNRIFSRMQKQYVEQVIMEVSSHALDMGRVYGCAFDTVVFTNISQDHLDYHGNKYNYFYSKSLLFSQLGNEYNNSSKYAIINADDCCASRLKKMTAQNVLTYGIKERADVQADNIEILAEETKFTLKSPLGTVKITSRLLGEFNIYNMLAAASAALVNKVPLQTIQQAFSSMPPIPGRFERVETEKNQDFTVIVDYAHTPDAVENILKTSRNLTSGSLYSLLGCGGNRDAAKRPLMANAALNFSDYVIFTSDNPRDENPEAILEDMTASLDSRDGKHEKIIDRGAAIRKIVKLAKQGDVVVIAGKGHETYQEIDGIKYPFDDRKAVQLAIRLKENV